MIKKTPNTEKRQLKTEPILTDIINYLENE